MSHAGVKEQQQAEARTLALAPVANLMAQVQV